MKRLFDTTVPRSLIRGILIGLGLLFLASIAGSIVATQYLSRDLPSIDSLQTIEPSLKTLIFSANGDTLREFYTENRTIVPLTRIPRRLQEAVIATEDRRFYDHYGIDLRRLVKVIIVNLTSQRKPGASTLTQQLARNLFLTPEKLVTRKLKEMILAVQIEQIYTKDEILAMYLNQIYMGRGTYGMQSAARLFFGKNVWDLASGEMTMLAGIIQIPERYSPITQLDAAYRRRATVLETMVQSGYLSRDEARQIGQSEVQVASAREERADHGFAAYFVEEVRKKLEARYGAEKLYQEGLKVWTTLVPRYQAWMEEALEGHLVAMEVERNYEVTRAVHDSLLTAGEVLESLDYLQAAALLQDVRTGAVLGMVGGRSFADSKWNLATQALRQPGSIFKPIVYLTSLQNGYTAASILMDTPFVVDTGVSLWRPKNFSGKFRGPITLRYSLSRSVNAPTAKFYLDYGLQPVIANARRLGISAPLPAVPALFLGAAEVTLREMVAAYATFANHGVYVDQYLITRVESAAGEILEEARIEQREVLDPGEAYMMTNLLQTTLLEGTGRSARWRGFTKTGAGKTGTTNDNTDAWFCGFTPSFCGGVWVGFNEPISMRRGATGARMALPIWASFMGKITNERGEEPFIRPPGIEEKIVCLETGMLATSSCDSLATEVFLPGSYPQALCDKHGGEIHDFSGFDKDFETLDSTGGKDSDF